jgi:transposase-like protein
MGGMSRTADGRRRWRQWTETEARAILAEFAESGESQAGFARRKGVSSNRLVYWRKRVGETTSVPSFVQVRLPAARTPPEGACIEIVIGDVAVRAREEIDVGRLAALVRALAGREPAC